MWTVQKINSQLILMKYKGINMKILISDQKSFLRKALERKDVFTSL